MTESQSFDLTRHLRESLAWAAKNVADDLNALAEERAARAPASSVRSPIAVVAHLAASNQDLAGLLRGQPPHGSPEERRRSLDSISTREKALEAFAAVNRELDAMAALGDGRRGEIVEGPFGPTPLSAVAGLAALHTMYHDGQLNQTHQIHGDPGMHRS